MKAFSTLFSKIGNRGPGPIQPPVGQPALQPARGTILIADDDDVVRKAVRLALKRFGYRVLEASTGVDAVLVAAEEEGTIDMILADVIMPSLTTDELESRLRALRPRTPIAFMSGYIHDDAVRHSVVHGQQYFLEKPFTLDQLQTTVNAVLATRTN